MLSPGVLLGGRYRLDNRIASGGMGDVWRGTDEVLGRTVAVKSLLPALLEDPGFAERFRGEARTMATINHPGVVDVYDYGSDESVAYLVMEYVEGDALSRTLSRVGRLTPARTMSLVAQAAEALQAAHDKGIVHRDVKPGNLLVRPNGTLVLTDFGIARSAMAAQLTAVGSVLGTASYISPEQAAGSVASPASDLYSLGVVAYQCLAGHRPFEGENPLEIAMKHVREVPRPLPGDIPPVVRSIVDRSMSKDPAARWPTAATLAAVARQAAAALSAGAAASSGPAGTPMSVPPAPTSGAPGQPVSGAPMSPGPVSPGVAGARPPVMPTRVMSGSPPTGFPAPPAGLPRRPVSGAPAGPAPSVSPGGFARGAAVVPPPRPADPTYGGYGPPTGPYQGAGQYQGPGPYQGQPRQQRQQQPPRRTGLLLFVVVAAVLAVLACSFVLSYAARKAGLIGGEAAGNGASLSPGGAAPGAAKADLVSIPCDQLKKDTPLRASNELKQRGFTVKVQPTPGGRANQIHDIGPCSATAGAEITITVRTGRDTPITPGASCVIQVGQPICTPGSRD